VLATIQPQRLRVLVVDDDLGTVDSTAMVLRLVGHDVKTALNGPEGVARVAQFQPAVALVDLGMPGMNGYETAREIQRLVLPKPPVLVALSGYGDVRARRESVEAGFDLHLTKPVESRVLDQLQMLVEERVRLRVQHARFSLLREDTMSALASLAVSHIQMGNTMLDVASTTEDEATRQRCAVKAQAICDRLATWVRRYPYLRSVRHDLQNLVRRLP
jgi:CheY-like chemotaxis protein